MPRAANDLSPLVSNANTALGAIAGQNQALDRSLVALPPFMRQANTTFVNLRAALDDLDPLVAATQAGDQGPRPCSCADLRPVAERVRPGGRATCATALRDPGQAERPHRRAARASGPREALAHRQPARDRPRSTPPSPRWTFTRPYSPDLTASSPKLGQRPSATTTPRPLRAGRAARSPAFFTLQHRHPAARPACRLTSQYDGFNNTPTGVQRASSPAVPAARRSRSPAPTHSSTTAPSPATARSDRRAARGHEASAGSLILGSPARSSRLLVVRRRSVGGQGYLEVAGYFDNGGFVVKGEEVRIAGANGGLGRLGRRVVAGRAGARNGSDDPGKAVVVMKITDPGFQDFRQDASCLIRPQSLLGEKFIDCTSHPAALRRDLGAAPADGHPRRRAGRGAALPAAREQRQAGRPRHRPGHAAPAVRPAVPPDPQQPGRRPRRAAGRT